MNTKSEPSTHAPTVAPARDHGLKSGGGKARPRFGSGRRLLVAAAVVGTCVWLGYFIRDWALFEETDDAYVAGHVHQISPQLDGTVQAVLVHDNQTVRAGDVLVRLDPLEFTLGVQKAEASLAQAHADESRAAAAITEAEARIAEAKARGGQAVAQVALARARFELARINRERDRRLFGAGGAVAQSEVDNTESAFNAVQAELEAAQANAAATEAAVASARALRTSAEAQAKADRAASTSGEAALADARRRLAYATIAAPADGRVGNKNVEPGNRVQAGETLFALVEPKVWIVANFKETQLARIHAGLPVELTIDALPGRTLHGTVDSVAPASGAEFALLPADNATGNFTKVVQRVPVKISLDPAEIAGIADRIRPGLSAVASVRVR